MPHGSSQTLELFESVGLLNRALRQLAHVGELDQKTGFAGISILGYVYRQEPARATDIAHWHGIGPAAMSRQVADLEAQGLLRRTPCTLDARVQLISLTAEGRAEVESSRQRRTDLFADLLADWDEDEISQATSTVNRIQQVLRAGIEKMHGKTTPAATVAPKGQV
ncbi:MarR family winged helix-turn-helix transcriptional regulator [Arthrobacter sp. MYb227]|uniref:MarR family winged helix-turn-helix transcriptional regulator n=1 Tax=Arthrobacter sp. MYb227 TaxID=1848601 RepID=UPI001C6165EB|nr:MarR family winged helix-turn-helix transcriptional regulator [Arthrobacter sp. MYb227]